MSITNPTYDNLAQTAHALAGYGMTGIEVSAARLARSCPRAEPGPSNSKQHKRKRNTSWRTSRSKELMQKETALIAEIEHLLPDFARSCRENLDVVIIHQD